MDEELLGLERALEAAPGDVELARRLERALRRRGAERELLSRYEAKFGCDRPWAELIACAAPGVRRCRACSRQVALVTSPEELASRVREGSCAAVQRQGLPAAFRALAADPTLHFAADPAAPCVIAFDRQQPQRIVPRRS